MVEQRKDFRRETQTTDARRLIFVDEFGTHCGMTRLYGRAPRGERAYGKAPGNPGENITLVMGMGLRGIVAPLIVDGAMDSDLFEGYARRCLGPKLHPEDIVIVDGLPAHRFSGARAAIEAQGAHFRILPPYSPDLSPVENCGSKVKTLVRGEFPRTKEEVYDAIGRALRQVTRQDAGGWFRHGGYVCAGEDAKPPRAEQHHARGPPDAHSW